MPETNLSDTLTPSHLADLPEDEAKLREQVATQVQPEKKPVVDRANDPRNDERYTFTVSYRDARGKLWEGSFTSKILSLGERQQMGVLRAQFQAGTALDSLDMSTADLNMKLAHLIYSLAAKPKWADSLRALLDPGIIDAIYEEVASHEAFFLGWLPAEGTGQAQPGGGDSDG